ncbi:dihydrofolate reductase [Candidatus Woesearchaeota archaeon]|nr:dihydrofolate reductase [Candidatus Woesearchaeota archaeon]
MTITIIAAMTKDRVIGKNNKLLWHISEDLQNFKEVTTGNTVIMGRKTFDSIGKPLPNRHNIVVSSKMESQEGVEIARDLKEAIHKAEEYGTEIFIIGGAQVYEQALPLADKMVLSYVKGSYDGDAFFPAFDESEWIVEEEKKFNDFVLRIYIRRKNNNA